MTMTTLKIHSTAGFPLLPMELSYSFFSIRKCPSGLARALRPAFSLSNSHESASVRIASSKTLQNETLGVLEWSSICKQLSTFTLTSMGSEVAKKAEIPFGRTREESQKLLDQTTAAQAVDSQQLDFSGIDDVSGILNSAASGNLLTIAELCSVRRTLKAAKELFRKLEVLAAGGGHCSDRYLPLLEILQNCDFQVELERKIEFCIDCNFSIIRDRASEDLELIRLEKKRNMEELDSLLKAVSSRIYQAGGIDRPLITKRRARMCVAVRASHKYLLPDGIVLNVSSSGATYFVEPRDAVDLNNMEVRLSNSERAEEIAILSMLTTDIAESEEHIKFLLERILELDLALARAAYARWMSGVCPCFSSKGYEGLNSSINDFALSVDIDAIQNPLLLNNSLKGSSDNVSYSANVGQFDKRNNAMNNEDFSGSVSDFPVPIDIKIKCQTRVVVISGPNTGGKTASIKTLGLVSLMAKAGMYLPAKDHPKLPWFEYVLADIGDHQSLEQNLSTFSGHISRVCKILEASSNESLVLIDEIGSGTDPSEGVALSTSILQHLKNHVNLALVTTHYADLTRLKDTDYLFENAAVEFSLKTLKPTYRILWGSTGDSNALNIAKSIGFDPSIIEGAQKWMMSLTPEKQDERRGLLFKSLIEERNKLEARRSRAASLHAETFALYNEIRDESEDLDKRETALKAWETQQVQLEIDAIKSKLKTVVQEFEQQQEIAGVDQLSSLIRKTESTIASICEASGPANDFRISEVNTNSYTPRLGEQVCVTGLGKKLATVVEASEEDETILVQYGKIKVRVKKSSVRALPNSEKTAASNSQSYIKRQGGQSREFDGSSERSKDGDSYGPAVQTSKNTVDLRGMRVEEASYHLDIAISSRGPNSVLFIIHGMGTGAIKEHVLETLKSHPRVAKFDQESPMNYGCTVAYIK